jgi:Ca2+-binding EF-hand superfamily protein
MRRMNLTEEKVDQLIEEWHNGNSPLELHEFLGMTNEQYSRFVESNELPQYTNRNKKDL